MDGLLDDEVVPHAAVAALAGAATAIRLRDFSQLMALELRLAASQDAARQAALEADRDRT